MENESEKCKTEHHEMNINLEDVPLFDSLWNSLSEMRKIKITSEYIAMLLQEKVKSLQKNVEGLEKILKDKYQDINFNGDFQIKDGKIVQELKVVNIEPKPAPEAK
jgi:hypothetical protein